MLSGGDAAAEEIASGKAEAIGVGELLAGWVEYLSLVEGKARATVDDYSRSVARFLADAGARTPTEISLEAIERHLKRRSYGGAGASRLAGSIVALRLFCRYLVARGLLAANPAIGIALPRRYRKAMKPLTVPEVERLLFNGKPNVLPTDARELVAAAMFALQYGGALRTAELGRIRLEGDVEWLDAPGAFVVTLRHSKHARGDVRQRIGEEVSRFLGAYLRERRKMATSSPFLFPGVGARPLSPDTVGRRFTELCRARGIEPKGRQLVPKILRTSRCTHLLDRGGALRVIQAFMRHASIETTAAHYTYTDEERIDRMLAKHDSLKRRRSGKVAVGGVFKSLVEGLAGAAAAN